LEGAGPRKAFVRLRLGPGVLVGQTVVTLKVWR
jgi:hypothetical protein